MEEIFKVYKETAPRSYGHLIYEVSNFGRVRVNGKIVVPFEKNSYYNIGSFYIHRAVAELFVPNPENKPEVDHIDTDIHNNHVDNLRWVTHKENCNNHFTRYHNSDSHKGYKYLHRKPRCKATIETKQKLSESHKGKIWVNNGEKETLITQQQVNNMLAVGWKYGRLKKEKN